MRVIKNILAITLISILLILQMRECVAQDLIENEEDNSVHPAKLRIVAATAAVAYTTSMGGLYFAWYRNHPQSRFHFYDDFTDWLQMDKGGHMVSSYYIGHMGYEALRWAGMEEKKAVWYGGLSGSVFLATIEIFDGFSAGWGASLSDVAANTLGSAAFISQQLAWGEQRMMLKFSYSPSKFAAYRPDLLGANHFERVIKDYNGISYWLSVNPNSFGWEGFPRWLNIAAGYSATGMTGGSANVSGDYKGIFIPEFERKRQFLLSLDIDLSRIETRSENLGLLLKSLGFLKIPFPTIELNSNKKLFFHPLYF